MKNNSDLLNLTQKGIVQEIHEAYLKAGADIIETNSFNGQRVSQADFGLEDKVREMNIEAARLARAAADKVNIFLKTTSGYSREQGWQVVPCCWSRRPCQQNLQRVPQGGRSSFQEHQYPPP